MRSELAKRRLSLALYLVYLADQPAKSERFFYPNPEDDPAWASGYEAGRLSSLTLAQLEAEMRRKTN